MIHLKKTGITLILITFTLQGLFCQKVDNIRTEQTGDLIKIYYKILDSNPSQLFRVSVHASLNGGLKSELKSISGDYGDNVVGGRDEYMVLWDVLKDVEEVKTVEFFVKAELIKSEQAGNVYSAPDKKDWSKNKLIVQAIFQGPYNLFGVRAGYTGKWGMTGSYAAGSPEIGDYTVPGLYCATISLTKSVLYKNTVQLHLFTGLAFAKMNVEQERMTGSAHYVDNFTSFDTGFILNISRLSFSAATSYFKDPEDLPVDGSMDNFRICLGAGVRF